MSQYLGNSSKRKMLAAIRTEWDAEVLKIKNDFALGMHKKYSVSLPPGVIAGSDEHCEWAINDLGYEFQDCLGDFGVDEDRTLKFPPV